MRFSLILLQLIVFLFIDVKAIDVFTAKIQNNELLLKSEWLNNGLIEFSGDVLFHENSFLYTDSVNSIRASKANKISMLHSWNNQPTGYKQYNAYGYGTYIFKIKLSADYIGENLIIRPNHFIAYASEIYVNGELVAHNGRVGKTKDGSNYTPYRNTEIKPFVVSDTILNITILTANYHHFRGGIFNKLKIGQADAMISYREKALLYDLLVVISLLIMFLYHMVLFISNTKDLSSLFFSLTCVIFAVDLSFQDNMAFFLFFPNVSFALSSFLHLSMPYLLPSSFIFFLYSLFPDEASKQIRNFTAYVSITLILLTALNIGTLNGYLVKPNLIYTVFSLMYVYYVVIKATINKRNGALLFLVAYILFFICALNDILFVFEIIYTVSLVSTGLIFFIFILSILQGRRLFSISNRNMTLTKDLLELNLSLEQKVQERTEELNVSLHKLKQLDAFKEDMTSMIVHDLKTPLSSIINIKQLNNEDGLNLVQQSGYKMLNLIQNILGVYKYQNAKVEIRKSIVRVNELLSSAFQEVKLMADMNSVTIDYNEAIRCELDVDEDLIKRVLVNLFSNAIKFSPKGAKVKVKIDASPNNRITFHIINQGPDIPKEKQALIFERFGQVEKEKSGKIESSGLGLTFCKMAVEAHDGNIGVDSQPGKEIDFWFALVHTNCKKCGICKVPPPESSFSDFLASQKEYLVPFITQLKDYKVYQVTAINKILKEIDSDESNIRQWLKELDKAIYNGDQDRFTELLMQ